MEVKLARMLSIAVSAHSEQFDKGGKPYFLHCVEVCRLLDSKDEELSCIAIGHDLLEDTVIKESWLREKFGDRIADGIVALTRIPGEKEETYQSRVLANPDAVKVKMQDLRHNSDLLRLKGVRIKDLARLSKYAKFFHRLKEAQNG
jgi:(p)ppGpp synthase/HD superfamily hydrolase